MHSNEKKTVTVGWVKLRMVCTEIKCPERKLSRLLFMVNYTFNNILLKYRVSVSAPTLSTWINKTDVICSALITAGWFHMKEFKWLRSRQNRTKTLDVWKDQGSWISRVFKGFWFQDFVYSMLNECALHCSSVLVTLLTFKTIRRV